MFCILHISRSYPLVCYNYWSTSGANKISSDKRRKGDNSPSHYGLRGCPIKKQKCLKKSGMVPKSQEWWQGIWNINFFRQSLKITSDILRYIRYSALQCHLAAAFCFIINVAWFIFSDLSSDARTFSCLYFKRYIIYGQNSQSQVFQQNNMLKSCIGSLVESENCNRTASPPDLAHCAPPP